MSESSEDEHSAITPKPQNPPVSEAISGCLDVIDLNVRRFNARLTRDNARSSNLLTGKLILASYSVSDSLSSTNSMLRFLVEVSCPQYVGSAAMAAGIHELLTSPGTLALIISEGLFLVAFSFLANHYDKDNEKEKKEVAADPVKIFIVNSWPYFRDWMKGMKNGYRGLKTTMQIITSINGADVKMLVIPLGLAIGLLATLNRSLIRHLENGRVKKQDKNKKYLDKLCPIDRDSYNRAIEKIKRLNKKQRVLGFLSMGLGGLLDGVYLYAGVVALATLSSVLFIIAVAFSAFYVLTCIISRLYEEYEKQVKCDISSLNLELELTKKYVEFKYAEVISLIENLSRSELDNKKFDLSLTILEINLLIQGLENIHKEIAHKSKTSYLTAVLFGFRQGLFAYGVLACFLFMFTSIFAISNIVFPPVLLMVCIVSGVGFIGAIIAHSVRTHYLHTKNLQIKTTEEQSQENWNHIKEYFQQLNRSEDVSLLSTMKTEELNQHLKLGSKIPDKPRFIFQNWLELIRSFFTGMSKGNSFSTFVIMPFQDFQNGQPPERTPWMIIYSIVNVIIFALILAFRAVVREFKQLVTEKNKESVNDITEEEAVSTAQDPTQAYEDRGTRTSEYKVSTPPESRRNRVPYSSGYFCQASRMAVASAASSLQHISQGNDSPITKTGLSFFPKNPQDNPLVQDQITSPQMRTAAGSI